MAGISALAAAIVIFSAAPASADDDVAQKVAACGLCHGMDGKPVGPSIPVIWGQQVSYLTKQLHDFRSDDRHNAIMAPVAAAIAQPDTRPIAAYFAAKPWPASTGGPGPDPSIADKLDQCQSCHQPGFVGGPPAPRLAGLNYQYLVSAMRQFANGQRTNNLDMPKFMQALTEDEREKMAKFLAGL
jgi:cytochrome c553